MKDNKKKDWEEKKKGQRTLNTDKHSGEETPKEEKESEDKGIKSKEEKKSKENSTHQKAKSCYFNELYLMLSSNCRRVKV